MEDKPPSVTVSNSAFRGQDWEGRNAPLCLMLEVTPSLQGMSEWIPCWKKGLGYGSIYWLPLACSCCDPSDIWPVVLTVHFVASHVLLAVSVNRSSYRLNSSKTNRELYSSPFIHVFIDSAAIVLLLLILTFLLPSSPISSTYAVLDTKVHLLSLQTIHLKQNSTNYRTNQTTNCEKTSTKRCILRAGWSSLFLLLSLSPPPCFCRVFLLIRLCFYY